MQPDTPKDDATASARRPDGIVAVLLLFLMLTPPVGLTAWILAAGPSRAHYLRSWWVRTGYGIVVLTAIPLLLFSLMTSDPNPNPIGLGLLFAGGLVVGCVPISIGVARVWFLLGA